MSTSATLMILRSQLEANHGPADAIFDEVHAHPARKLEFFKIFADSHLFVLETEEGAPPYVYQHEGRVLLPVFSALNRIAPFISGSGMNRYRRIKTRQLLEGLQPNVHLYLNPRSENEQVFTQEEFRSQVMSGANQNQAMSEAPQAWVAPTVVAAPQLVAAPPVAPIIEPVIEPVKVQATPEVVPELPKVEMSRPVARRAAVVVRRNPPEPKNGFPTKLMAGISAYCSRDSGFESVQIALIDDASVALGNRVLIGVSLSADAQNRIDDLLGQFAVAIDPFIGDDRPVEICLIEESELMRQHLEKKTARQIYAKPFAS